jgi:hypothetical protein
MDRSFDKRPADIASPGKGVVHDRRGDDQAAFKNEVEHISKLKLCIIWSFVVIPVQAGIQCFQDFWMPAFAGMTAFSGAAYFEIGSSHHLLTGDERRHGIDVNIERKWQKKASRLSFFAAACRCIIYQSMKKRPRKPNGRNIELALELLELSLILKAAVKKAMKKKRTIGDQGKRAVVKDQAVKKGKPGEDLQQ